MEEVSGRDLEAFFQQWIFTAGHPYLKKSWDQDNGKLTVELLQFQEGKPFVFPLELEIVFEGGTSFVKTIGVDATTETISIKVPKKVIEVRLDPNLKLLFVEK